MAHLHNSAGEQPAPLSMGTNILWSSVGSLTKTLCSWLITVAVVRLSEGFDAAGILALAMSISNIVIPIAEYRLRTVHVTDVTNEHTSHEYMGLRLMSSAAALIVGVVYTLATTDFAYAPVIVVYSLSQLVATYAEGFHAIEQRAMRMDYIGISYLLQGFGSLLAFVAGIYFFQSLLLAVTFMLVAMIAVVLFYDLPRAHRFEGIRPSISWKDGIRTFTKLFPLAMVTVALSFITLVPRQYLERYASAEALGVYASVAVPAVIIQASAAYMYTPVLGRLVQLLHWDTPRAKAMLVRIVAMFVGLGIAASAAFWVAGDWILALIFGQEILPYTYLIQPALAFSLITACLWFTNDLLLGLRDSLGCFLGGLVAVVATLAVTIPFTHAFKLNGPSMVGIFASLVALTVMGWFLIRDFRSMNREHS